MACSTSYGMSLEIVAWLRLFVSRSIGDLNKCIFQSKQFSSCDNIFYRLKILFPIIFTK